ncbi:NYN domain-containing protein [Candidatus Azambacteria bacterium]|nr:NYN domain-containing protein [Candidatus Azambacteria bacterium]
MEMVILKNMDLRDLKKKFIRDELGITEDYGRVFSFLDFSNVNKWFENDDRNLENNLLAEGERVSVYLEGLKLFADIFSERARIYYGEDPKNIRSLSFTHATRKIFGKFNVVTKDLQKIKHYIELTQREGLKYLVQDKDGKDYVEIRKCNFDVEISVDAIKMLEHHDTFCIFSGDADFVYLNNFLKKKGKKIIIVKGGFILTKLRESADLVINAQDIKKYIARIECK